MSVKHYNLQTIKTIKSKLLKNHRIIYFYLNEYNEDYWALLRKTRVIVAYKFDNIGIPNL